VKDLSEDELEIEKLTEFGEALEKLVKNPELFGEAAEAVEKRDAERFQAVLSRLGIPKSCLWICRWFCVKIWKFSCAPLCPPEKEPIKPTVKEMLNFGKATVELTANKEAFTALFDAYKRQDAKMFRSILTEWKMMPYCRQFCGWFAYFYCRRICWLLCPEMPVITHVGNIPTSKIDTEGYANGPSQPPGKTDAPDVSEGCGDHPFGGWAEIRGILQIAKPDKYKVEYSSDLASWTPIMTTLVEWNGISYIIRKASPAPDPGWYNVAEMVNMNYLTDWRTPSGTGKYYLRLTVKNTLGAEFVSEIIAVRVDNQGPIVQLQNLRILRRDGTEKEIKCGGIKKGEGKIVIRFRAEDRNFGKLTLVAEGGCGITKKIIDETTGMEVDRSYEGNVADTGEPPWRKVIWNPWAEEEEELRPCCYLIVLRAWDRAIINNYFHTGHWNRDHEAVEIAI
jgi:hypothetical protein